MSDKDQEIPPLADNVRNVAHGIRSLTVQNLLTTGLGFVFLYVVLHLLPPFQYGVYAAVYATYSVGSVVVAFGLQYAAARFLALLREKDEAKSWMVAKAILLLSLVFSTTATVLVIAISPSLSLYFTKTTAWSYAFILGSFWIFSGTLSIVFQAFVQGLQKYNSIALMSLVSRAVAVAFSIATLPLFHSVAIPIIAWILNTALVAIWSLKITGMRIFRSRAGGQYGLILKYSIPLGIAAIISIVANTVDQFLVAGYLNSIALAVYNAAVLVSAALGLVLFTPLVTALLPELSARTSNPADISNGLKLAIRFIVLITLPASFIMAGVASQLLQIFTGNSLYSSGALPLEILSLLFVLGPVQGTLISLLQALGRTVSVLITYTATVITVFALSVVLIPIFGINGAAFSNALLNATGLAFAYYFTKDYLVNLKQTSFYGKVLLASVFSLAPIWVLSNLVSRAWITIVPFTVIALIVFLGSIKLLKILSPEDKMYLKHLAPSAFQKFIAFL